VWNACPHQPFLPAYIASGYPVTFIGNTSATILDIEAASAYYYNIIGSPSPGFVVQRSVVQASGAILLSCYVYVGLQSLASGTFWAPNAVDSTGNNTLSMFPFCGACPKGSF